MKEERYRYEVAEKILDAFALKAISPQFRRSYRKLKAMVVGYAYVDFLCEGVHAEQAIAWSWEDAEMTFLGRGEPTMTGAVMQMWLFIKKEEKERFAKEIKRAFKEATEATSLEVPRRFLSTWRDKPVCLPEDGFDKPSVLPCWGPRMREWAVDNHEDPDALEEQFTMLELGDRELLKTEQARKANLTAAKQASGMGKKAKTKSPKASTAKLRLVTTEDDHAGE